MTKLVRESLNELAGSFYPEAKILGPANAYRSGNYDINFDNEKLFRIICKDEYWKGVAEALNGNLVDFDHSDYTREIIIAVENQETYQTYIITQEWERGNPIKPLTTINGKNIGRFEIGNNPKEYATNILEAYEADQDNINY